MEITKIILEPSYKKENGAWSLDTQLITKKLPFEPKEQALVYLPPTKIAGNHRHAHTEALIGLGSDLDFVWQDAQGNTHKEVMYPDQIIMFLIPPFVPHAVVNNAKGQAILYEYFDSTDRTVERMAVVPS